METTAQGVVGAAGATPTRPAADDPTGAACAHRRAARHDRGGAGARRRAAHYGYDARTYAERGRCTAPK